MIRVSKKTAAEITDRFEAALDSVSTLDRAPFHIKREAAENATQAVLAYFAFLREEAAR